MLIRLSKSRSIILATAELIPMGTITAKVGDEVEVGNGPKGNRLVADVPEIKLESERINATLAINDAAD